MSIQHIQIGGNAQGNAIGDNSRVINRDSFNAGIHGEELAKLFTTLNQQITPVRDEMKGKDIKQLDDHLTKLTEEAKKEKPNPSVLSFTAKGVLDAAKTVGEIAGPVVATVGSIL